MRCVRLGLHHRTGCRHGMCRCCRAAPCMALTHCMRCTESAQSAALPVSVAFLRCRGRRIAAHRIACACCCGCASHRIASACTAQALHFVRKATRAILLSGTPMISRPYDIFNQVETDCRSAVFHCAAPRAVCLLYGIHSHCGAPPGVSRSADGISIPRHSRSAVSVTLVVSVAFPGKEIGLEGHQCQCVRVMAPTAVGPAAARPIRSAALLAAHFSGWVLGSTRGALGSLMCVYSGGSARQNGLRLRRFPRCAATCWGRRPSLAPTTATRTRCRGRCAGAGWRRARRL